MAHGQNLTFGSTDQKQSNTYSSCKENNPSNKLFGSSVILFPQRTLEKHNLNEKRSQAPNQYNKLVQHICIQENRKLVSTLYTDDAYDRKFGKQEKLTK